jgi:hypothetical protein
MGLDTWSGVLFWVAVVFGASLALAILAQLLMWWVIVGGMVDGLRGSSARTPNAKLSGGP